MGHTSHRQYVGVLANIDTLYAPNFYWQSCPASLAASALLPSPAYQTSERIFILLLLTVEVWLQSAFDLDSSNCFIQPYTCLGKADLDFCFVWHNAGWMLVVGFLR